MLWLCGSATCCLAVILLWLKAKPWKAGDERTIKPLSWSCVVAIVGGVCAAAGLAGMVGGTLAILAVLAGCLLLWLLCQGSTFLPALLAVSMIFLLGVGGLVYAGIMGIMGAADPSQVFGMALLSIAVAELAFGMVATLHVAWT